MEHIWDHLGWRVGHPTSLNELEVRSQKIRNEMSQGILQNFYASMPDRIASCIRARVCSTGKDSPPLIGSVLPQEVSSFSIFYD
ncbi:hypothetical protein TNCV_1911811 [Trichonephila clavipes]|nr:hypothetical protein TNCV_1911811 [Trichonephila clavipes]